MFALKASDIGIQLVDLGKRMLGSNIEATTTTCEIKKYMFLTPLLFFLFYKFPRTPIRTWMIWLGLTYLGAALMRPGDPTASFVYLGMVVSILSIAAHVIIVYRSYENGYGNSGEVTFAVLFALVFGVGVNGIKVLSGTFDATVFLCAILAMAFIAVVFSIGYGILYSWMRLKKHPAIEDYINRVCRTVEIIDVE